MLLITTPSSGKSSTDAFHAVRLHSICHLPPRHPPKPCWALPLGGQPRGFWLGLDSGEKLQETARREERGCVPPSRPRPAQGHARTPATSSRKPPPSPGLGVMGCCPCHHLDALMSLLEAPPPAHSLLTRLTWIPFPARTVTIQTLWRRSRRREKTLVLISSDRPNSYPERQ